MREYNLAAMVKCHKSTEMKSNNFGSYFSDQHKCAHTLTYVRSYKHNNICDCPFCFCVLVRFFSKLFNPI